MLNGQMNIFLYDAALHDIDAELIDLSEDLRLKQKESASEIDNIRASFTLEEELIRNKMSDSDKVGNEYKELMNELAEMQDERDRKISKVESEAKDYESFIDIQKTNLETQRQAIDADLQGMKEYVKEDVEKSFGYFQ